MSEQLVLADLLEQLVILSVGLRQLVKGQKDRRLSERKILMINGGNEAGGSVPTWLGWDFFRSNFASQSLGLAVGVGESCSAGFNLANKRDPCLCFNCGGPRTGWGKPVQPVQPDSLTAQEKKKHPDMNT